MSYNVFDSDSRIFVSFVSFRLNIMVFALQLIKCMCVVDFNRIQWKSCRRWTKKKKCDECAVNAYQSKFISFQIGFSIIFVSILCCLFSNFNSYWMKKERCHFCYWSLKLLLLITVEGLLFQNNFELYQFFEFFSIRYGSFTKRITKWNETKGSVKHSCLLSFPTLTLYIYPGFECKREREREEK